MLTRSLLLSAFIVSSTAAQQQFPQGMLMPPQGLPPLFPPHIEALIPADKLAAMKAIHENMSLPPQTKHQQIDDLMISLPGDLLDRIPAPPGFDRLPKEVQDKFKALSRDRSLSWFDRQTQIRQYVESLPAAVKALIPMPGPSAGPPGFDQLPADARSKIHALEADRSLSFRERYFKIKAVMDALPAEIRAKLPAAPPPPPYAL